MKSLKQFFLTATLAAASLGASAEVGVLEFSYNNSGELGYWGTEKLENFDLAIRIADPSFVGKEITSITLPIRDCNAIKDYKIWLSTELKLEKKGTTKVPAPDVLSQALTPADGKISLTLTQPYKITDKGIYVGCSFVVSRLTDETKAPCRLSVGSNPDGLYVHTSRSYLSFLPISEEYNASVPFSVMIKGDFPTTSVEVTSVKEIYGQLGEPITAEASLVNLGTKEVKSIDYSYTIGEEKGSGHYDFSQPLQPNFTRRNLAALPIITKLPEGNYPFTLRVDKVNGETNLYPTPEASSQLILKNTAPIHRAVVEEYTGLWCGYCPRGFVGLEKMNKLYPDKFIGLSYHNGDEMEIMKSTEFPQSPGGFPAAFIDRTEKIDAYLGRDKNVFGLDKVWLEYCDIFPMAAVTADAYWADDKKHIEVNANVRFVKDINEGEDSYRLVYYLLGNGMTDPDWKQSNNYRNNGGYYMDKDMNIFTDGDAFVKGLVFNDVVIQCSGDTKGIPNSIEAAIVKDRDIKGHYTFDTTKAVGRDDDDLIAYTTSIDAVVMVLEKATGKIVNATKKRVAADSSIASVNSAEKHEVARYAIDGKRLSQPTPGLNIIKYDDGTAEKVMVK